MPTAPRSRSTLLRRMALLIALVALTAPSVASAAPTASVFARGIDNPRGLAIGADGTLYVAVAGRAGPRCLDPRRETCAGFTGRILAIDARGNKAVVADGLVSAGAGDGTFATGPDDVAVGPDGRIVTVITSATPDQVAGIPKPFQAQLGELLQVAPVPRRSIGSIDAFEWAHNSDRVSGDRNSNPYGVLALAGHDVVADAGANAILDVRGGVVSLLAVIPKIKGQQPVPTSVALGPDGNYYVGTLAFGAGRKGARIYKVPAAGGTPTIFAVGFTAITGLDFGPDGSLYVTELTSDPEKFAPTGAVVKIATNGQRTRFTTGLVFPAGMAVSATGDVYVSNYSTAPSAPSARGPFKGVGGRIVKITGL